MTFKELRESSGMNKTAFAQYFKIPYRTVQNWEAGVNSCPEYLLELMEYKLINERIKKENATMKKFEIRKNTIVIAYKNRKDIKAGITLTGDNQEPEIMGTYSTLEEAKEELKKYTSLIDKMGSFFGIEEYYIEENVYDEDDEWEAGGDVWEFSPMKIELVEKSSYNTIAVFDNMEDAEEAYDNYDGDEEVYLSF